MTMRVVIFLVAFVGGLPCAAGTAAAQSLTEAEAVRLGLAVGAWRDWADASMDAARSRTRAAGRWANPEFEFIDESLDLPGGNTERYYWLRQPLDLSGRKSLERAAARAGENVTSAEITGLERDRAAVVRTAFYRTLKVQREIDEISQWRDRLHELSRTVAERVEVGDASRFDRLRLERERALLDGRIALARSEQSIARERLFGLLQQPPRKLSGRLLPDRPPGRVTTLQALHEHPELVQLRAAADSDRLRARAAGRKAWPEVTLGVGVRDFEDGPLSETGGVFSVGIEVPLFERGRQSRAAAEADAGANSAEAALSLARLQAEARGLLDQLDMLRAEALTMIALAASTDESLPAIAEAAYGAGEIGIMALIDAWQAELELRLQAVQLEFAARMAAIELLKLTGENT